MGRFNVLFAVFVVIALGILSYFGLKARDKTAFVYNQKVFDQFTGKLELESKLAVRAAQDKRQLDSLRALIEQGRKELVPVYDEAAIQAGRVREDLNARYTADVWRYINDGIADFGKENGYDYVFGASGNGSLMYADTTHDVTAELVRFLNSRYTK